MKSKFRGGLISTKYLINLLIIQAQFDESMAAMLGELFAMNFKDKVVMK